jgi:hypothetical protein
MATTLTSPAPASIPKGRLWTGRIISWVCILFLLFDASLKIILNHNVVESSAKMGWPVQTLQPLGFVLLACIILYAIPRTAILGAVLLTAWLGGATAESLRIGFPLIFPVLIGILVWLGLWLRDDRLRSHLPMRR